MRNWLTLIPLLWVSACSGQNDTQAQTAPSTKLEPRNEIQQQNKLQQQNNLEQASMEPSKAKITREQLSQGYQDLRALTEDKSCDTTSQCQLVAVGSRACGGPNMYMLYSTKTTDAEQVQELARSITENERIFNRDNGMVSICEHVSKPVAQCKANQCSTTAFVGNDAF